MPLPREITLENTIEDILFQDGYRQGYNENYDKGFAVDKKYLFEFLEVTQPKTLERHRKAKGKNWKFDLLSRLHSVLEKKGVIEVLRHGFGEVWGYTVSKSNPLF